MTDIILRNAIRTPDGTVIESHSVHDFTQHTDNITKKTYAVDGGLEYLRRVGDVHECQDLSVIDSGLHSQRRELLKWGNTRNAAGKPLSKIAWIPIKDLGTDHIRAILATQKRIRPVVQETLVTELQNRTP